MPFVQHLAELRQRAIVCLVSLVVASGVTFYYSSRLIEALQHLAPQTTLFFQLSPGEVFLASFKLSMFAGFGLTLPIFLYHTIRFVSPGLKPTERITVLPLLLVSLVLFAVGVLFGYKVILPMMLGFLLGYGQAVAQNQLSIAAFLDFCTGFLFASGLVFQLPLFLLFTAFTGLIDSARLRGQWRWALVASFLMGAIITPSPDPFSQVVMATSLFGLYGLSLMLMKVFGR